MKETPHNFSHNTKDDVMKPRTSKSGSSLPGCVCDQFTSKRQEDSPRQAPTKSNVSQWMPSQIPAGLLARCVVRVSNKFLFQDQLCGIHTRIAVAGASQGSVGKTAL